MIDKKYKWLEVMRGFAAVWVLLHHATLTTTAFGGEIDSVFFSRGLYGVDFFFILSGFIITFSVSRMIENGRGVKEYISARFLRIYLPYWPIGISLFFAYTFFPDISAGDRDIGLFTSLTLLPTHEATALSVAWTLKHELLFYAIFSSVFLSRQIGMVALASWLAFILISFFAETQYSSAFLTMATHPLNLWFFVGISIFYAPNISIQGSVWVFIVFGLSLCLYAATVLGFSRIYIGIVLASITYMLTKISNISLQPPKFFLLLGAASYSIYLVHNPVQSIIARVPKMLGLELEVAVFFTVVTIGSLMAGLAYYFVVESRAVGWSKAFLRRRHPPIATAGNLKLMKESSPV